MACARKLISQRKFWPYDISGNAVSRRAWLHSGTVAVVGALTGCVNDGAYGTDDVEPPSFGCMASEWPQAGFDAQETAVSPAAEGPLSEPTIEWEIRLSGRTDPRVAATDSVLVVAGGERMHLFDLEAGERAWGLDRAPGSVPALDNQHLYVLDDDARVTAYPHDDTATWDST